MSKKDWTGNKKSIFVTLAASNHSETEREVNDYYATEPYAVELLLNEENFNNNIWEPCCGGLHISNVLTEHGYNVRNSDILQRGNPNIEVFNFLEAEPNSWNGDIITNPPYILGYQMVETAMNAVNEGNKVAMFLKVTFLEGQARRKLFEKYPPKVVYVSSSRLNCAKGGDFEAYKSSAVAYAWFVWEKGFRGDPIIKWIN